MLPLITFTASAIASYAIILFSKKFQLFQPVRRIISDIRGKSTTPTLGGLAVFFALSIATTFGALDKSVFLLGCALALLGFTDDYAKLKYANSQGIRPIFRIAYEIFVSGCFVCYSMHINPSRNYIPFIGNFLNYSIINVFWGIFLILSCANSVNLTDGIDSLAGMICIYIFAFLFFTTNDQSALLIIASIGGFLVFNWPPAKIYMGDTGSLGLGALIAGKFYLAQKEWWLLLVGIILVLETSSSIIQMTSLRWLKKKFFRMAPLHHHFEKLGYNKFSILILFNSVAIISLVFAWYLS